MPIFLAPNLEAEQKSANQKQGFLRTILDALNILPGAAGVGGSIRSLVSLPSNSPSFRTALRAFINSTGETRGQSNITKALADSLGVAQKEAVLKQADIVHFLNPTRPANPDLLPSVRQFFGPDAEGSVSLIPSSGGFKPLPSMFPLEELMRFRDIPLTPEKQYIKLLRNILNAAGRNDL